MVSAYFLKKIKKGGLKMEITELSASFAVNNTKSAVGTKVLSQVMDTNEQLGQGIVNMMDQPAAMERSVNPAVGA